MSVAAPQLEEAIASLSVVATSGAPGVGTSADAIELIDVVERAQRLAAVAAVDAIAQIDAARAFYEHGHANARVMFAHAAGVSGREAFRLDQIRRMIAEAELISAEWRKGRLSVDKAALIGKAFANPRTRERFLLDQRWFIKQARRFGFKRLKQLVARWLEVHDQDGSRPDADPSFERRRASIVQDYFSKCWKLEASLGSMQGSTFNETLRAYLEAEFRKDWDAAEQIHGKDTNMSVLARTHEQRMADALCQIAADAVNSDKPSAPVKTVHHIVWTAETYEDLLRQWVGGASRILNPDTYRVCDLDGHPLAAGAAFANSVVRCAHLPSFLAQGARNSLITPAGTVDADTVDSGERSEQADYPETRRPRRVHRTTQWSSLLSPTQPLQRTRLHGAPKRQRRPHHHPPKRRNHPLVTRGPAAISKELVEKLRFAQNTTVPAPPNEIRAWIASGES